jgi:hypothetical protein
LIRGLSGPTDRKRANGWLELRQGEIDEWATLSLARPIEVTQEIVMSTPALATLDLDRFLLDPGSSFRRLEDVIGDPRLRRQQKIEILGRWAYDATELAVAEEEGMSGESSNLHRVLNALVSITGGFDAEHTGPTKHAGCCIL